MPPNPNMPFTGRPTGPKGPLGLGPNRVPAYLGDAVQDGWGIPTTQSPAAKNYAPNRSSVMMIASSTVVADQAPVLAANRAGVLFSSPNSRVVMLVAAQPDSAPLSVTASRSSAFFRSPASRVSLQAGAETNTFADWTQGIIPDRAFANYSAPRSQAINVWENPAAAGTDWPGVPARSPSSKPYSAPASRSVSVWLDTPPATDTVSLSAVLASTPARFYAAPRAQTIGLFDPALNTFADYAPPPVVSARQLANAKPPSMTMLRADGIGTDYATTAQSRIVKPRTAALSMAVFAADNPLLADAVAPVVVSMPRAARSQPTSLAISPWLNQFFGTEFAPQAVKSPRVYPLTQRVGVNGMAWDIGSIIPAAGDPGGGGFGALMDAEWIRRYEARYGVADKWARIKPMRVTRGE